MALTKNVTKTLPATGGRTIEITTVGGVQVVSRYHAIDNQGEGHLTSFTVAEVLAAHPEIDAAVFGATLAIFRVHGDALLGFSET